MLRTGVRVAAVQPLRRGVASQASAASGDKRKQRPLSPHVQIFKFPLPAMVSVATRFTGVGLTAGVAATGVACLLGDPAQLPVWIDSFKSAVPVLVPLAKAVVAFPFVFHTASGLRHLYWDTTAKGLELKSVHMSSYAIIAASVVGTIGLAAYTID